ncbi:MAG: MoaD/ThiS family protein [Nitrososphaerota archaeon]|nr:MoaD/ThiS family protein [Candidatus Bathyarchaeota archaeon]MDW8024174.1 MoaD/ThiS family protein [Nitrososphaerota archaeon]
MITVKVIFIGRMVSVEQILDNTHVEVDDGTTLNQFLQTLSRKFSIDTSSTLILLNNKDVRCLPPDFKLSNGDTFSIISIIAGG